MRALLVLTLFLSGAFADHTDCASEDFEYQSCPTSGAPGDFLPFCRFSRNYVDFHNYFPSCYRILLDTYDYQSLYAGPNSPNFYPPVWENIDSDGDFNTWLPDFGGLCTNSLFTCTFHWPNQNNWLFTQFVCLQDAKELFFNVTFRFSQCTNVDACENDFVTLHRYCVDDPANRTSQINQDNYMPLNGTLEDSTLQQIPGQRVVQEVRSMLRPVPRTRGCHFGIHDSGTCGQVDRLIVYYTVCPAREQGLVVYPEFANPPRAGPDEEFDARCVCNAHPATSMRVIASSADGTCLDEAEGGARCECDDGYEESDSGYECLICPPGEYKAGSVSMNCQPCPWNTTLDVIGTGQCECLPGHFRSPSEGPDSSCTVPPEAVSDLQALNDSITTTTATIKWLCPPDTGRDDITYLVCTTDLSFSKHCYESFPTPEKDLLGYAAYVLKDLTSFTTYIVTVTVANGVSELDFENEGRRVAEVILTTAEGVPNEPFLKRLCTVVIWKPPTKPQGIITSYRLCFGSCDNAGPPSQCHTYQATDNFHVTSEQQRKDNIGVVIRAGNRAANGSFTECLPIDCDLVKPECPTLPPPSSTLPPALRATAPPPPATPAPPKATEPPPTAPPATPSPPKATEPPPKATAPPPPTTPPKATPSSIATHHPPPPPCSGPPIYFTLGTESEERVEVGGSFRMADIGVGDAGALICWTSFEGCCKGNNPIGEFYDPTGVRVPLRRDLQATFRNRGTGYIRFNRRGQGEVDKLGEYQCCILNGCGYMECVSITLD